MTESTIPLNTNTGDNVSVQSIKALYRDFIRMHRLNVDPDLAGRYASMLRDKVPTRMWEKVNEWVWWYMDSLPTPGQIQGCVWNLQYEEEREAKRGEGEETVR